MILIERGREVPKRPGVFEYRIPSLELSGRSRQPLLDACRQIKSILGDTGAEEAAIYREGRTEPDVKCPIAVGARSTVKELDRGRIGFVKWTPFELAGKGAKAPP